MFCTQCGNVIPDNYKFCTQCGSPLAPAAGGGAAPAVGGGAVQVPGAGAGYVDDAALRQREEEERIRRQQEAREAQARKMRDNAAKSEANTLNKLVFITREEGRTGCRKNIEVERDRFITVDIPAGTSYDSHVEIPGQGRFDTKTGVRGVLRLSFAFED